MAHLSFQDGVDLIFLQKNILVRVYPGNDLVVKRNDAILQGIADGQISGSVLYPQIVRRETTQIQDKGFRDRADGTEDRRGSGIGLGETQSLFDIDGIGSALELKFDSAPVGKVRGKRLALCAVVGRGQPYRQLDTDDIL